MKYLVTVAGREIEVEVDGDRVTAKGKGGTAALTAIPGTPLRQLVVDGSPAEIAFEPGGAGRWTVLLRGEHWEAEVIDERTRHIRSLTGAATGQRGTPPLKAPMPGLVLRVLAEPGQVVAAGSGVVVLEAMKMENELRATAGATVRVVRVKPGEAVEKGQVLVEFESR
ncbi:MAG: biotin/lipoyl-containing protein [Gemmatimonadales bacterium]